MLKINKTNIIGLSWLVICTLLFSPITMRAQKWKQYTDVEKAGWSAAQLEAARQYAAGIGSAAIMIVDQGNVVAAWGEVRHPFKAASMRKSLYDGTIGASHYQKSFDINTPLNKLQIDDQDPLSDQEKKATFEQLMMARSGIYHPAAYETESNAQRRPERNSALPGDRWYYNNWDFNVICPVFQQLTKTPIEDAFAKQIARPLGMEDFESDHIFRWLEPRVSNYPAVTFRISARDLARFGKLYLNDGKWKKKQILSPDWIKRSTKAHTIFEEDHYGGAGNGYGRLWWVYPARPKRDSAFEKHLRVAARGAGGQIMILFPELDLLIVHLADTDSGRGVSDQDGAKLMNLILSARKGTPSKDNKLGEVRIEKLSENPVKPLRKDFAQLPEKKIAPLTGRYMFNPKTGLKLYQFEKRLFVQPVGLPLTDVEMFEVGDGTLRSPLADLVLKPVPDAEGKINAVQITFRGQTQTARRTQ